MVWEDQYVDQGLASREMELCAQDDPYVLIQSHSSVSANPAWPETLKTAPSFDVSVSVFRARFDNSNAAPVKDTKKTPPPGKTEGSCL